MSLTEQEREEVELDLATVRQHLHRLTEGEPMPGNEHRWFEAIKLARKHERELEEMLEDPEPDPDGPYDWQRDTQALDEVES